MRSEGGSKARSASSSEASGAGGGALAQPPSNAQISKKAQDRIGCLLWQHGNAMSTRHLTTKPGPAGTVFYRVSGRGRAARVAEHVRLDAVGAQRLDEARAHERIARI